MANKVSREKFTKLSLIENEERTDEQAVSMLKKTSRHRREVASEPLYILRYDD